MKVDDSDKQIKRLLRVFSLKGMRHRTSWTQFKINDEGIKLLSDTDLRCILCSKLIDWEPIVKTIDGKKLHFDSPECVDTYMKYKSVYGSSFE
jgi:hypothetical protein